MQDNIQFQMSDGLVIKGAIMGDVTSKHLIIFLHSGEYNRHEFVVKEVKKTPEGKVVTHFREQGNYDYFSNYLKEDAALLFIDLRNHGKSRKNIDIPKMRQAILDIVSNIEETKIQSILQSLKENNKTKLNTLIEQICNSFYPAFFKLNIPIFVFKEL